MISLDNFYEDEWTDYLRTRDQRSERRSKLPIDFKFDRLPRGKKTNAFKRQRNQTPIRGIKHRRNKKVL